jgi:hypothetical protein
MPESTGGFRSGFNGIAVAADNAVNNGNMFTGCGTSAFKTDSIIIRVNDAVGENKTAATVDINPVIVAVAVVGNQDAIYDYIFAIQIMQGPYTRVLEGDACYSDIITGDKQNIAWPSIPVGAKLLSFTWTLIGSTSIYDSRAGNSNVLRFLSIDQGIESVDVLVRAILRLEGREINVICAGNKSCSMGQVQLDIVLHDKSAGQPVTAGHDYAAASGRSAVVDGFLYGFRA